MEFFIIKNDEQQGPFTLEQLSGMSIMPDTPVWCEGMSDWTTASQVAELQQLVAYAPRVDSPAEPPAMPQHGVQPPQWNPAQQASAQQPQYTQSQPQYSAPEQPYPVAPPAEHKPRKSHTALWVTLAVVALLAAVLAVTNPDKQDHCRAISSVTKGWTQDKIDNYLGGGFFGGITKMVTAPLMSEIVDGIIDVDNYGLCSVGHIDLGDSQTKVSFGIMGHVFTFNKNQIDEKIEEAIGMKFDDAVNTAKQGIEDLFAGSDEEPEDFDAVVPSRDEDDVTAEERLESSSETPAEVDTILKTITKEGAKLAGKAIDKAIDEMFE